MLERQFTGNAESRAAGMLINTMGWIEGVGYEVAKLIYKLRNLLYIPFANFHYHYSSSIIVLVCCLAAAASTCN